jgi:2-keto-4-pentenoate hydratase
MVVLTGSLCGEIWVERGQKVIAEDEGLGSVSARCC